MGRAMNWGNWSPPARGRALRGKAGGDPGAVGAAMRDQDGRDPRRWAGGSGARDEVYFIPRARPERGTGTGCLMLVVRSYPEDTECLRSPGVMGTRGICFFRAFVRAGTAG